MIYIFIYKINSVVNCIYVIFRLLFIFGSVTYLLCKFVQTLIICLFVFYLHKTCQLYICIDINMIANFMFFFCLSFYVFNRYKTINAATFHSLKINNKTC